MSAEGQRSVVTQRRDSPIMRGLLRIIDGFYRDRRASQDRWSVGAFSVLLIVSLEGFR
jgi:hypothetical protein